MQINYKELAILFLRQFSFLHFRNYFRYKKLNTEFNSLEHELHNNYESKPEIFLLLNHWGGRICPRISVISRKNLGV